MNPLPALSVTSLSPNHCELPSSQRAQRATPLFMMMASGDTNNDSALETISPEGFGSTISTSSSDDAGESSGEGATPSSTNNFQGRYAIRHWWTGPIACKNPQRGVWGGPPDGGYRQPGVVVARGRIESHVMISGVRLSATTARKLAR